MNYLVTMTKPSGYIWDQKAYETAAEAGIAAIAFIANLAGEYWEVSIRQSENLPITKEC